MIKKEFTKITKEWLYSKGFIKSEDKAWSGIMYFYSMSDFDVIFVYDKNRFGERYNLEVGFQLKNIIKADGSMYYDTVGIEVPKKYWHHYETADGAKHISKGAIYYEQWSKEDYLAHLEDIYKTHIKPYLEKGVKHLKAMVKQDKYSMIHPDAVKVINNM